MKAGGTPGFPRFKGANRYDSFTYPQTGFSLSGKHLQVAKIGNLRVRLSRTLPTDAKVKTCTIKRTVSGWFATLVFEYEPIPLPASNLEIGLDVGIEKFAALNDGSFIENPRLYQRAEAELRRDQRRVSRRKKGSSRRRKAVILLRKVHERIRNQRLDFLHKVSTELVQKYGAIAVEDLNISGMAKSNLAKQILDCSWSIFFNLISYKAVEAGRRLVRVDAKYTSQTCSQCGYVHKDNRKTQAEFRCISCGFTDHADHNAAVNILNRARTEPSDANVGRLSPCVV